MGQEPDELRADIERTREGLGQNLDALTEKVSPARVVSRRVESTKQAAASLKDKVMGGAEDGADSARQAASRVGEAASSSPGAVQERARGNPFAAGVVAFGLGWLVSSLLPASPVETRAAAKVREVAEDQGGAVTDEIKSAASQIAENVREPARQAVQAVQETARDSGQRVSDEARGQAEEAKAAHSG